MVWALQWASVLAPELRGQQNRDADHVVLHERAPAPPYDIKCASASQARELLHRVQHHLMSLLQVRMLDADLAGSSIEDAEIPPAEVRTRPPHHTCTTCQSCLWDEESSPHKPSWPCSRAASSLLCFGVSRMLFCACDVCLYA